MSTKKAFASTGDMTEKKVSFTEVGPGLFAFTAEGDPNGQRIGHPDTADVVDCSDDGLPVLIAVALVVVGPVQAGIGGGAVPANRRR